MKATESAGKMTSRAEITMRLAGRLKTERATKGLSLDALANLSGVSRSMLSQIERGESSPTVASLWNLTRALNVDFSSLLDQDVVPDSKIIEHMRDGQTPIFHNREAGCVVRILSPVEEAGGTEVYDITFEKAAHLESTPHKKGCVEHLTVLSGSLDVASDGEQAQVSAGDTLRYAADVVHSIKAQDEARALLIVKNA
jgi:transcriptional regulator with XRE-family HTH domain